MKQVLVCLLTLSSLLLFACARSGAGSSATTLSVEEGSAMCVLLHEKLAQCPEAFIDSMLELRAEVDPEVRAALEVPEVRAEMRRVGIEETLADGTGPLAPRQHRCTEYARMGPPSPVGDRPALEACYEALPDCRRMVACVRPILEARTRGRARQARGE